MEAEKKTAFYRFTRPIGIKYFANGKMNIASRIAIRAIMSFALSETETTFT